LSVFTGGWTLKAAETVGADDILPQSQVLELLSHLVDKSLAVVEEQNSRTRYRLLETIRQYGEEKLQASGEKDKVQTRHLEFFLQFAEKADPKLVTNEQKTVLAELDAEYGNLRSALDFALETDPIRALQLSIALDQFWESRGYIREGRNAIERALQQAAGVPRELRAEALRRHAGIADRQGDYVTATASAEESLKLWREIGNKRGIANSLRVLGNAVWVQGDYVAAKIYHEECIAILREIGDKRGIASTLNNLGNVVVRTGDYAAARRFEEESVALFRELGDHLSLAMALNNLGVVAEEEDDKDDARRYYEESISISHELGEKTFVVYALNGLAHVLCVQGDLINAWRYYRESLVLSHQIGEKRMIAYCLEGLAKVASRRGRAQNAVRFLGAAHALRQVIGAPLDPAERTELDQDVIATRKQMDDRAFELGWADGRAMSLEKAIEFALKEAE
jgi:tetratricopeptide (TPR) repeat protein